MPEGRRILYVSMENPFMQTAKAYAAAFSLDREMPTGSVIVKEGKVIARGANGSEYHEKHECERVRLNIPTGEGYDLCEGCHPKNHSENKAVEDAKENNVDTRGADLFLWGHWWCCKSCWDAMIRAGIRDVYLLEGSERLFNKKNPENIVGKQFSVE